MIDINEALPSRANGETKQSRLRRVSYHNTQRHMRSRTPFCWCSKEFLTHRDELVQATASEGFAKLIKSDLINESAMGLSGRSV